MNAINIQVDVARPGKGRTAEAYPMQPSWSPGAYRAKEMTGSCLEPHLTTADLPDVLDRLFEMSQTALASGDRDGFTRWQKGGAASRS